MTLETATYINQLNSSYPEGAADRSTADDHLRLIKATVKATFPAVTGPVSVTQAELNLLAGLTTTLVSVLSAYSLSISAANAAIAAHIADTAGAHADSAITFTPAGTSAVASTVQAKLREWVSVKDFGATGDGTTDDTAAIQAAVDSLTAGGTLYFPPGSYKITDTLTVDTNYTRLQGAGMWNTIILHADADTDAILFTGNDGTGAYVQGCGLDNMTIKRTVASTAGAAVKTNGVYYFNLNNVYVLNGFIGFDFVGLAVGHLSNVYLVNTGVGLDAATGRIGMKFTAAAATYSHPACGDVFINNFNVRSNSTANMLDYGIQIASADGIWFSNGHVGNTATANIQLTAADADNHIGLVFFDQVMSDACLGYGIHFTGTSAVGRNILFNNCHIKGGGTGTYGVLTSATAKFYGVQWTNCVISEFKLTGIQISSPDFNKIDFTGCSIRGNSYDPDDTSYGIRFLNADGVTVTGGSIGHINTTDADTWQNYAISFGGTNSNITITGVDLRGNTTGSILGGWAEAKCTGCLTGDSTDLASAATLVPRISQDVYKVTGTTQVSAITGAIFGKKITLVFADAVEVIETGNIKLSAAFTSSADDVLELVYDGTHWVEVSRSVN